MTKSLESTVFQGIMEKEPAPDLLPEQASLLFVIHTKTAGLTIVGFKGNQSFEMAGIPVFRKTDRQFLIAYSLFPRITPSSVKVLKEMFRKPNSSL